MAKKIYRAFAYCVTVIFALTFAEAASASAIHQRQQRREDRHGLSRHHCAARQRVKAQRKAKRRKGNSYVCPMHADIRSKSHGTCPKCLMDLVVERRTGKGAPGDVDKEN